MTPHELTSPNSIRCTPFVPGHRAQLFGAIFLLAIQPRVLARYRQALVISAIGVGTVLVAGGHAVLAPAPTASMALVVAGIGFLAGVRHGAIDHLMAKRLTGGTPILGSAVFAGVAAVA